MKLSFLGLCVLILSTGVLAGSSTVNKLESDTRRLKSDLGEVQKKLDSYKTKLTVLEQKLAIPSQIANDLGNLDKSMTTVKDVSSVASVVPPIRSQAEAVKDGIDEVQPPVTKAKEVMEKVAETIEPIREQVIKARDEIEKLEGKVGQFKNEKVSKFYTSVLDSQSCVDKAIPEKHSCMQSKMDKAAAPADKVVADADKTIETILNEVNKVEGIIADIENPLDKISGFIHAITLLEHGLHLMIEPFLELRKLLHKHFVVKFPYPNPHNIFKMKWFKLKLSGQQIIKGIKHIIAMIKKMLKGALLKAAKIFGLKKLALKFFHLLDHPLKFIMKKLHLKLKIELKGIGELKDLGLKLENPLKGLKLALKGLKFDVQGPKITACGELSKMCK